MIKAAWSRHPVPRVSGITLESFFNYEKRYTYRGLPSASQDISSVESVMSHAEPEIKGRILGEKRWFRAFIVQVEEGSGRRSNVQIYGVIR